MKKYQHAIEITLAILLILAVAGYLIPNFNKIKDMGKNGEAKDGLHTIQLAIEKYAVDTEGEYPPYLIGGDQMYASSIDFEAGVDAITGLTRHTDLTSLSDPLLRLGYLESYPRNPFVGKKNAVDIAKLQEEISDPLRNGASGPTLGCRFGGDCTKMGNVSADYRQTYFKYKDRNGIVKDLNSHADFDGYGVFPVDSFQIHFTQPKYALPGQFVYLANGPYVAADPDTTDATRPIQPIEFDRYELGVYGSNGGITKGNDVLGGFVEILNSGIDAKNDK